MGPNTITDAELSVFHRDGYLIVSEFLTSTESEYLQSVALNDEIIRDNALDLNDQENKKTKLTLWFSPGDDIYGNIARSEKMVDSVGKILDSNQPVCHFHTKLMQKEPKVGGAWEWHQDYGYWYKNQFLYPDKLTSVMIAITEANKENGCLQVIKGSHKLGRVNHGFAGEQVGADMIMVDHALKSMELVYVELNPGDALFFHSNILHRSAPNTSEKARWSMITCFNSLDNVAFDDQSEGWKNPIEKLRNQDILKFGSKGATKNDFLQKENDPALKKTGWESNVSTK